MVPEYLRGLDIPPVCHTHAAPKWNQTRGIEIPGTTNTPLHNIMVGQVSYEEGQRGRGAWVSKTTGKKKKADAKRLYQGNYDTQEGFC